MATQTVETSKFVADAQGRFGGEFGGRFVPETIIPALDELVVQYERPAPTRRFARSSRSTPKITLAARRRCFSPKR